MNTQQQTELIRAALTPQHTTILNATSKAAALSELIARLADSPIVKDVGKLTTAIQRREALMSTGIGLGLAVPHVRLPGVDEMLMTVGVAPTPIEDYESLDDCPVRVIAMIVAPAGQHADYLRLLSAISSRAKTLGDQLASCTEPSTAYSLLTTPNS